MSGPGDGSWWGGGRLSASCVPLGQVGQARGVPGSRGRRLAGSFPASEDELQPRSCTDTVLVVL